MKYICQSIIGPWGRNLSKYYWTMKYTCHDHEIHLSKCYKTMKLICQSITNSWGIHLSKYYMPLRCSIKVLHDPEVHQSITWPWGTFVKVLHDPEVHLSNVNSLHAGIFSLLFVVHWFFQNWCLQGIPSKCQTVWIQIKSDWAWSGSQLLKKYQQMRRGGKELISTFWHIILFYIWASTQQNLNLGFPTKPVSNQSPQLQRLARNLKFHLFKEVYIWYFPNRE